MRRERGCAGLSRGAGVEWDVTGISQCLSRNENDFLCHMLSFLTLSLCAFSLVHLLGIITRCVFHLSLSSWILLAALLYKNLNKFGFFFLKSVRTVGGSVCVPCGTQCRDSQAALGHTGAVAWPGSAQDSWNESPGLSLQSSPWPKFNPLHFCNPAVSCSAGVCRLEAKPGWVSQFYCAAPVSLMGSGWAPAHPTPLEMDCLYHKQMAFCIPGVFSKGDGGFLLREWIKLLKLATLLRYRMSF